jgi:competence protein ComFC
MQQDLNPLKTILKATLDLVFPRNCVHCSNIVDSSPYDFICARCASGIIQCLPPACNICGYPFYGTIVSAKTCSHCTELNPFFDQGKTLFLAKGVGRSILHELKYRQGMHVLKDLSTMVQGSRHYLEYIQNATLVPVPLHPTKVRERGFNQSEQIAQMLVCCTHGSARIEKLLIRKQYTQSQTSLNRSKRYQNVKNAFALAPDAVLNLAKSYIIIDDVFTTGSTLNACARILRKAGAIHLKVATIGHG